MKTILRYCGAPLTALLICTAFAAGPTDSGTSSSTTRVVLWNGTDIDGWSVFLQDPAVAPRSVWSVHDGVLRLTGQPKGYLRTIKTYANYRLHVEWRWPTAVENNNSGVFIHMSGPDLIWADCVECQLKAGLAGNGIGHGKIDFDGLVINGNKVHRAPPPTTEKPIGEWNEYDITCRGDTIEIAVNGVHRNRIEKLSSTSGGIGLQLEGTPVEFRNIWLEPL